MALVLPRRLAPVLPTTYSPSYLHLAKAHAVREHWGFPYHTCVHCKGFAPAAPRRAGTSISVSLSGLPLSRPVLIFGLVVHYTANYLISRRPILWHEFRRTHHSRLCSLSGVNHSFPWVSLTKGHVNDVLLSVLPILRSDLHGLIESP